MLSLPNLAERKWNIRAGKVLKWSNMVAIKVVGFCIKMSIKFVRLKSNFHAYDFVGLKVARFSQLDGPASRQLWGQQNHMHDSLIKLYTLFYAKTNSFYYYHAASFQYLNCPMKHLSGRLLSYFHTLRCATKLFLWAKAAGQSSHFLHLAFSLNFGLGTSFATSWLIGLRSPTSSFLLTLHKSTWAVPMCFITHPLKREEK